MRLQTRLLAFGFAFLSVFSTSFGQISQPVFPDLTGEALLDSLVSKFKPTVVLEYGPARDTLYSKIYKKDGAVECVYSGHKIALLDGVDPSQFLAMNNAQNGINCEHGYPQSKGAASGNAHSDMHHLFPTRVAVNSSRGNLPYGESPDAETENWFFEAQSSSSVPTSNVDAYAEKGDVFEPREKQKGNSARAVFYFFTMYEAEAMAADPNFFEKQRPTLCQWAKNDPADSLEWERTWAISKRQNGRPNPFVLDPTLLERTFCPEFLAENEAFLAENEAVVFPNPTAGGATVSLVLEKTERVRASVF